MAKVSLRAYNREIEAMIDRNHLDEAVAHCKHILKTFPKHLETYRLLGKAYLEYKRYPEAVDIFSRVLVAMPSDFVSNVGMSIIRDDENKLDDAIWHMERAFETQPSNAAIQSELQRLYSRRDGVQLPRIRMTHGALANMYVKGELYPQAISEIKSVLKEDPGRNDMQALLGRAYYRSGAKNDAAEVASALLRLEPYSLDANRILVEILGVDHPESVQVYRQRVVELDPYAAQVSGSIFLSDEVPDVAVSLERLDWNGQPVGMQSDWQSTQAISLEGEKRGEEPDWLKSPFSQAASQPPPLDSGFPGQGTSMSPFDADPASAKPAEPAEDIPDFLRAAGWGQSTGAFDESKPVFSENEPASSGQALAPGELPDWVKAMAPEQPSQTSAEEEELPDWINQIGTGALPVSPESADQPDWMSQLEAPTQQPPAQAAGDEPDWLKQLGATEQPVASSDEQPDWLKGFENEVATSRPSTGELDWLSQLGEERKPAETPSGEFDFLDQPTSLAEAASSTQPADEFDFLKELENQPETASAVTSADDFDFLNELSDEAEQLSPRAAAASEPSMQDNLGKSAEEQDDSFAWLENLAAKQGATEGLLTKPEERLEDEPDWIKQAKGMDLSASQPPVHGPAGNLAELGKSEQEQDDSFAWLESLAAKQGATEGLLTKPEERLEDEPEWVRQAKSLRDQPESVPSAQTPQESLEESPVVEPEPFASLEDLGKSEQDQEDSFAWLENLAAKQGATEGLLTQPDERLEEEPEWVRQAKEVSAEQLSVPDQTSGVDDTATWLKSLDAEESTSPSEPVTPRDDTLMWFRNLEASQKEVPPQPSEAAQPEDLPVWMQNLEEDKSPEAQFNEPVSELAASAAERESPESPQPGDLPEWMQGIEDERTSETLYNIPVADVAPRQPEPETAQSSQPEELPEWMQGIEEDNAPATDLNLPAIEPTAGSGEKEPAVDTEWMSAIDQPAPAESAAAGEEESKEPAEELPSWLSELDQEQEQVVTPGALDADLPAWLRDETGELVAEPTRIEPTRATDWQPALAQQPEPEAPLSEPEPAVFQAETETPQSEIAPAMAAAEIQPAPAEAQPARPEPEPQPPQSEVAEVVSIIEEKIAAAAAQGPEKPSGLPPRQPKRKHTGRLSMPLDPILGQARTELSGSNVSSALDSYSRLIKKGRFLEEVIFDLREATYSFPVDVNIWQSLGDAYMRANRLQDALDAYTKAEELLR
jgi:tetratricopeptide (TPR) repeat protein